VRVIRYVTEGSFDSYMWQTLERKARFIAQILTGELSAREVEDVDTTALSYAEVKALATGQPLLLEAATVAAEVARLRNLQTGHIRAQRRIRQDIDKLLGDADRSEERAGAPEAIADHTAGRDPVLTSYGGRPLADRGAIAKALAGATAAALQQGTRQHLGQWCGLSVEVAPTQTWGASSLEVTVRVAYRHAASFEFPKSWLQQGQQWRILAGLEQLVQTAPTRAAELRTAAAAARSRATDSQALLGRPFEHADQLAAALTRQQQLEAAMREQATAEAPSPPLRPAKQPCTGGRSAGFSLHRRSWQRAPPRQAHHGRRWGSGALACSTGLLRDDVPWASCPGSGAVASRTVAWSRCPARGTPRRRPADGFTAALGSSNVPAGKEPAAKPPSRSDSGHNVAPTPCRPASLTMPPGLASTPSPRRAPWTPSSPSPAT
jgi:hypothetical protein